MSKGFGGSRHVLDGCEWKCFCFFWDWFWFFTEIFCWVGRYQWWQCGSCYPDHRWPGILNTFLVPWSWMTFLYSKGHARVTISHSKTHQQQKRGPWGTNAPILPHQTQKSATAKSVDAIIPFGFFFIMCFSSVSIQVYCKPMLCCTCNRW